MKKNPLKALTQKEIDAKIIENIDNEAEEKSQVKHWCERAQIAKIEVRPKYMDRLTRKHCNVIIKARVSMVMVKRNGRKGQRNEPYV